MLGNECYFSSRESISKKTRVSRGLEKKQGRRPLYIAHLLQSGLMGHRRTMWRQFFGLFMGTTQESKMLAAAGLNIVLIPWPIYDGALCSLIFRPSHSQYIVTSQYYFHIEVSSELVYVCRTYYYQKYKKVHMGQALIMYILYQFTF